MITKIVRRVFAPLLAVAGGLLAALFDWGIQWSFHDSFISCSSPASETVFGATTPDVRPYLSVWPRAVMCEWSANGVTVVEPLGGWGITVAFYASALALVAGITWLVAGEIASARRVRAKRITTGMQRTASTASQLGGVSAQVTVLLNGRWASESSAEEERHNESP